MAAADLLVNGGSTTVTVGGTTAPSAGTVESWTVAATTGFVAATGTSQFRVQDPAVLGEIMLVTNVSGSTWTVTRGAENYAGVATPTAVHTAGFTVAPVLTAGALSNLIPTLDATATDIKPDGVQTAGAVGKAADAGHIHPGGATQVNATNATWPIPVGATLLEIIAVGGGGGGGGGGSATGATIEKGAGGGGSGAPAIQIVSVGSNTTLAVTIGTGGAGGTAGAAGAGAAGGLGTPGVATTVTGTGIAISGSGGMGGIGSAANSSTVVGGGPMGFNPSGNTSTVPAGAGSGGPSLVAGNPALSFSGTGGGGGGSSSTTLGGGGGGGGTASVPGVAGTSGASGTSAGVVGVAGAANTGSGGGGGGGGTAGTGAGGVGGAGGSGYVIIKVIG